MIKLNEFAMESSMVLNRSPINAEKGNHYEKDNFVGNKDNKS